MRDDSDDEIFGLDDPTGLISLLKSGLEILLTGLSKIFIYIQLIFSSTFIVNFNIKGLSFILI